MTDAPEVSLTSRRSAGYAKVVGALSALAVTGLVVFGIGAAGSWWLGVVIALCGALAVVVVVGMFAAVTRDAERTAALEAAGTRAQAEVVTSERVEGADDVVYESTLRIPLPDGTSFDVGHRCSHHSCAAAHRAATAHRPVLVDPATRAWAIVHGPVG